MRIHNVDKLEVAARQLADFMRRHRGRTTFLTGAGFSTESGIPDYRGKDGVYTRNPEYRVIYYQEFMASEQARQRYWARSFFGYLPMRDAQPNRGHYALARLQHNGWLNTAGGVTQNVDGLHLAAGALGTVELHGALREVLCTQCNTVVSRERMQLWLEELNPAWAGALRQLEHTTDGNPVQRSRAWHTTPDGDVEIATILGVQPPDSHALTDGRASAGGARLLHAGFRYPSCQCCGGIYKPNVVFFGESIQARIRNAADLLLRNNDALLVMGTSLAVGSAVRMVRNAKRPDGHRRQPRDIAMVNLGPTRGDSWADLRLDAPCAELLVRTEALLQGSEAKVHP
ncbi:DHS-like NAD/FAD-binding domain-containing protein [Thamnocephalis sphaerospora]|uniref:DHS-like NAD/FAD-binding domain-containing protein n=1 Tax=Thamnocephalis sphaerospora TaxID=78915 RepID=A0A4P9XSM5_9FUNG|nr:DHS-like NAD/FAD-binding domain-containing protein [Thamnocephalis sphaerospora]|eukprot:RKP09145.1 DHS-like NAD/FAD-binding domain-containing protein [Thamnocephalis sphaerospora]